MFDIGFAELLITAVLGLLILGPERLPGAIRTGSLWLGRLRRSFNDIRAEIEKEVGADEIRRQLHNESVLASLKETKNSISNDINQASQQVSEIANTIHSEHSNDPPAAEPEHNTRSAESPAANDQDNKP
jgi:sec-independent protein translocase protein TatB